jgi:hypothetical protein
MVNWMAREQPHQNQQALRVPDTVWIHNYERKPIVVSHPIIYLIL